MRHLMLFESHRLYENFQSDVKEVTAEVKELETEMAGHEDDDNAKAALLMQALDKDGDLEEVVPEVVKEAAKNLEAQDLNESVEELVHMVEVAGNILGNAGLMEFIAKQIHKATGKSPDVGELTQMLRGVLDGIKKATGAPAKAIEKFFTWCGIKAGVKKEEGQKAVGLIGKLCVVLMFFGMGIIHFPVLGTSGIMWWILSLTGLIGKSVEIAEISHKIYSMIVDAKEDEHTAKQVGITHEDFNDLMYGVN